MSATELTRSDADENLDACRVRCHVCGTLVYVGETAHDVEPGDDGAERFACAEHCETCRPLRVLSLFSGIGGLDLGLERAGMEVVAQCEVDPYCCRILAKHWPHVPNFGDVTTIDWSTVPDVDLICGGYPCQPFSYAGVRRGGSDPRHLWPHFRDAIRDLRPEWALLENVPGHLSMGFDDVLADLAALGFDAEWSIVSACAMGAPHTRERLFVLAHSESNARSGQGAHHRGAGPFRGVESRRGGGAPRGQWWLREPAVDRVAHGVPRAVVEPELRGLGNAVVPQVAEHVGRLIMEAAS